LHYNTETLALINAVHRYGGIVLLDCQQTDKTLDSARLVELLRRVDIFLPNADEAMKLTHAATVSEAIKRLGDLTPTVVVKLGAAGALARQGAKTIHIPAISVKAVDTTGAGDSFSAGFLYGYLNGESLETCLRCGNICGGLSTTAYGGATAAPTVEQLTDWLERYE
jgi:sugar/nucleoside kinase (ribokinase family)